MTSPTKWRCVTVCATTTANLRWSRKSNTKNRRQIVGICRLVADPDHFTAEFAVIIADAWQGKGIGRTLTDACLRIAKDWGIREVSAETLPQNSRMITIFKERKFNVVMDDDQETIIATKKL